MPGADTGLVFTNELALSAEAANHNLLNGSGLALGDYDGDGWCDIFICSLTGPSKLFRNLGNWKFEDATERAGLAVTNRMARGAVFADVNGDNHLDLLVTYSGAGVRLYTNNGSGQFRDAQRPELVAETGSMSIALGDVNGDGHLDLYVANYGENTIRSGMKVTTRLVGGKEQVVGRFRNRLRIVEGHLVEYGEPDALYLNDGKGGFNKVSWTEGAFVDETGAKLTEAPWELGFTAVIRDINQDGNPDIYVCNDFQDPDRLWLGDGKGHFRAAPREAIRSTPNFSMTADFADLNNDGFDDFFVTDMLSRSHELRMRQLKPESPSPVLTREKSWDRPQARRNFLQLSRGDGTFADVAQHSGVAESDWSWSAVFMDVDLDGLPDILVGTGHFYDTQDLDAIERTRTLAPADRNDGRKILDMFPQLLTPNVAFHNEGGLKFRECAKEWGFDSLQVSHSIALGDLDNDGDLDVVVNCLRGPALVYRNNAAAPRVVVKLKGLAPNTAAVGARLTLIGGAAEAQTQEVTHGSRFLAGDPTERVFAANVNSAPMTLQVRWRSGGISTLSNMLANRRYEIDESSVPKQTKPTMTPKSEVMFEDLSVSLRHRHQESEFDDFARQALPRKLSRLGPGVAWHDVNGDGRDDLIVGASRGRPPEVFLNNGAGVWTRKALNVSLPDDSAGLAVARLHGDKDSMLVGLSNWETTAKDQAAALLFEADGFTNTGALPNVGFSPGPIALADIDGDGDLDLFIGGRMVKGRYPEPAPSLLLLNENGNLRAATNNSDFEAIGLVTGALFSDINGDGWPDLLITTEWGPVRVYLNEKGHLKCWEPALHGASGVKWPEKLSGLTGWWTGISTGDFDNDGRLDIVLGNWGLNSSYQIAEGHPLFLYYGNFNSDGAVTLFEAYEEPSSNKVLPWRDLLFMEKVLPWLRSKFPTHKSYSTATVSEILGDKAASSRRVSSNYGGSMVLMNRGDSFEPRLLPPEAQWSPVMGACVADFNGDGNEDLLLSQNYFAVRPEDSRLDAGRGLLLLGNGHGEFEAIRGQDSGILVYGEQRGCAVADFDSDGRADLVIAQNGDTTKLFRNRTAQPGLAIRLTGGPLNPTGVGAKIRLEFPTGMSPAREVQATGGFYSQNSAEQIFATPVDPVAIHVTWPGGKVTQTRFNAQGRRVSIDAAGELHPVR